MEHSDIHKVMAHYKIKATLSLLKQSGVLGILFLLKSFTGLPIPMNSQKIREYGSIQEVLFWDSYLQTKGLQWPQQFLDRLNPTYPLQSNVKELLPNQVNVHILDVGSGPLTHLGKICEGKQVHITAVDPLADQYDKLIAKYSIQPIIRTQKVAAEDLTKHFPANTFDLVVARNSIDHAKDTEIAIQQMIRVVKCNCYILMEHLQNEAERQKYSGLHQWNFSLSPDGDFIISSKSQSINLTKKYFDLAEIICERSQTPGSNLLVCKIKKRC